MQVFLDDTPLSVDRPSIAAALRAGTAAAQAAGRVIVEATLNDNAIPGDDLLSPPDSLLSGATTIRLTSAEPRALVASTLTDVADVLPGAKDRQAAAADAIHDGRTDDALSALAEVLQAWDQVRQAVENGSRLLGLKLTQIRPGPIDASGQSPTVASRAETLGSHLAEIKRSIQARDWAGLADSLSYDLDEDADAWRAVLLDMAQTAGEGARGGGSA